MRQRGARDFLITISGRVLMTSTAHRSEEELARLACAALDRKGRSHVLLGGLGMGYTLRAALDLLPPPAQVTVADLNECVVKWCRGPLAELTAGAVSDRRVEVKIEDVAALIARSKDRFDAIALDLYEGPHHAANRAIDPLYGVAALGRAHAALRADGVLAVWSEEPDRPFETRFAAAGFRVQRHPGGRGGRAHFIYVGTRVATMGDWGRPVDSRR